MPIKSVEIAAPATKEEWETVGKVVKKGMIKGQTLDLGWRVLRVGEVLPKGNVPCHAFEIGDSEFVIVKLPKF